MKKIFSVLFIMVTALCCAAQGADAVFADTVPTEAKATYLIDYNSGSVLSARNENARLTIASMCKIMTLLLVFEEADAGRLKWDETLVVSEKAAGMGGSQAFLEANAEYKVSDLVESIVIASANDSCMVFAEKICGSEQLFVERMNERAKQLGMNNTVFSNCTGLPKPTQYSCAKDVAKMFSELIKHEKYFEFSKVWTDEIKHPKGRVTGLTNTNKLVRFYDGCDGGKTGYTSESGHCLTATAKRGGMRLIAVIICAPDSKTRFKEVSEMFNYGFANFTNKMIVDSKTPLKVTAKVKGGKEQTVELIAERDYYSFAKKNEEENFRIDFEPFPDIKAPVKKGDEMGELIVYKDNEEKARVKCLANTDVDRKPYFGFVTDVMNGWAI
ncbi:MAG: D-alanyl-D-alanine carboxypeptidase [Clostridia bacterium]|nr:D-alanyl-D-alanine carboxypeptidase [Clostridia bacterium]